MPHMLLDALKSIFASRALAGPLASLPLPYATIAAMLSSPSPLPPARMEQILQFLGDCARSGPLPAALTLTGALLVVLSLVEVILSREEELTGALLTVLPLVEAILGREEDVRLRLNKCPLHDYGVRSRSAEPTGALELSQLTRRLKIEAQLEDVSDDDATAEDTLDGEGHNEWCSRVCAILVEEMEASIEKDLMQRMEKEARMEKDVVERMEMDAKIENLPLEAEKEGMEMESDMEKDLADAMASMRSRSNSWLNTKPAPDSTALLPNGLLLLAWLVQNHRGVPPEKHTFGFDPTPVSLDIPELDQDIPEVREEGCHNIPNITYISDN